jgi:hypothetical protein
MEVSTIDDIINKYSANNEVLLQRALKRADVLEKTVNGEYFVQKDR